MNRAIKWSLYLIGAAIVLLLGLYVFVRINVGAVNPTLGETEVSSDALASRIQLADGFTMGVYAANIPKARMLRFTRAGDLLVAIPNENKIVLLARDADENGKADGARLLMRDLNGPNGLDFFDDWLYVAETDAIGRIRFDHATGETVGEYERIVTGLPGGGNHWKKTLRFGPDGLMYVTMGSSCNVCLEEDERRAAMVRYQPDGSGETILARGLRNSAGFDWRPADKEIYATDNGRDGLGDDFPPCELNRIVPGEHYGWPYANGNRVPDPDFGEGHEKVIEQSVPPVHGFSAHTAPLGIEFVRGDAFPEAYRGAAIVALHGSWNRSEKIGYEVVSLHWDERGDITERKLVTGFLTDGEVIGRPAEVTQGPDGAFYVADDYAGAVYRVAYGEPQTLEIPRIVLEQYDREETLAALPATTRDRLSTVGARIFRQDNCLECHSGDRADNVPLENIGSKYTIQTLMAWIENPAPPMPKLPYTDDDRRALAVYLIENH